MLYANTSELKPSAFNPPARISAAALEKLKNSIAERGVVFPLIVTQDMQVIDGHRRLACAKALGIQQVPVLVFEGKPEELFTLMNGQHRPVKPAEWLHLWGEGVPVPSHIQNLAHALAQRIGMDGVRELIKRGISPGIYNNVAHAARYCGLLDDDAFFRKLLWWVVNHKMNFTLRRAIADNVAPDLIVRAVNEDRPLVPGWSVG